MKLKISFLLHSAESMERGESRQEKGKQGNGMTRKGGRRIGWAAVDGNEEEKRGRPLHYTKSKEEVEEGLLGAHSNNIHFSFPPRKRVPCSGWSEFLHCVDHYVQRKRKGWPCGHRQDG